MRVIEEAFVNMWKEAEPFNYLVIDNFLPTEIAEEVSLEFPNIESEFWYEYNNFIEVKKACSNWDRIPASIYKVISSLLRPCFTKELEKLTGCELFPDYGLHGGGIHCHGPGGKLNTHKDYSIHPKTGLQRKLNIIIYVSKNWDPSWGGSLGFWSNNPDTEQPDKLITSIECVFNRAVIFDTTQNSWHGLPDAIKCPENKSRNSIAVYYNCIPGEEVEQRYKALFAPSKEQQQNQEIIDLIKRRSDLSTFSSSYKKG